MNTFLRKLAVTLILLTGIVLVIAYAGIKMIVASPVYEASLLELQNRFGTNPAEISFQFLRPFKFSEGTSSGFAEFNLCDKSVCYRISAQKSSGTWRINSVKK